MVTLLVASSLSIALASSASNRPKAPQLAKGLLPELFMASNAPEKTQLKGELMVQNSEKKALMILENLLAKKKGTTQEVDLLERRAELQLKQAKSHRATAVLLAQDPVSASRPWLLAAEKTLQEMVARFPKSPHADRHIFHLGFTQLALARPAASVQNTFERLLNLFPQSLHREDTYFALADLFYNEGKFAAAEEMLLKIRKNPETKTFHYAQYKLAWVAYNLDQEDRAIAILSDLIQKNHQNTHFDLRSEALNDFALFLSETTDLTVTQNWITKTLSDESEIATVFHTIAKLFLTHSKHEMLQSLAAKLHGKTSRSPLFYETQIIAIDSLEQKKNHQATLSMLRKLADECSETSCATNLDGFLNELINSWKERREKKKLSTDLLAQLLTLAIEQAPTQSLQQDRRLFLLAELELEQKRYQRAADLFLRAADASRDSTIIKRSYLASLLALQQGDLDRGSGLGFSLMVMEKFLKDFSKESEANLILLRRAHILTSQNDYLGATNDLEKINLKSLSAEDRKRTENLRLDLLLKQEKFDELGNLARSLAQQSELSSDRRLELEKMADEVLLKKTALDLTQLELIPALALLEKTTKLARHQATTASLHTIKLELLAKNKQLHEHSSEVLTALETNQAVDIKHLLLAESFLRENGKVSNWQSLWTHIEKQKVPETSLTHLITVLIESPATLPKLIRSSLESWAKNKKIEPIHSLLILDDLEQKVSVQQAQRVFQQTIPFSRSKDLRIKAKARWIQALIFDQELSATGVKSSIERQDLVLSIKLERLEKAQVAYLDVIAWSTDPYLKQQALRKLVQAFDRTAKELKGINQGALAEALDTKKIEFEKMLNQQEQKS